MPTIDNAYLKERRQKEMLMTEAEKKWSKLIEKISDPYKRKVTAFLLENEYNYTTRVALTEAETIQSGIPSVTATSDRDIAPYPQYLLSLVRRVYPALFANEIVGIQPLSAPTGLIFYLKYKYEGLTDLQGNAKAKGKTQPGTEYAQFIGNTWNVDPYYSSQRIHKEAVASSLSVDTVNTKVTLSVSNVTLNASPVIENTLKTRFDVVLRSAPNTVLASFTVVANKGTNSVSIRNLKTSPGFTVDSVTLVGFTYTSANNQITVTVDVDYTGTNPTNADSTVNASVDYDYRIEGNKQLPQISFFLEAYPATAIERVLRAQITLEAIQDLMAFHGADAEVEISTLLANEVSAEIDREILADLVFNAATRVNYDYSNPFLVGGTFSGGTFAIPGATNFDDRNRALMYQILEASNQIFRQTLRGAGNIVVTSPEIASKLESLREFKFPTPTETPVKYSFGIEQSGTINSVAKVYKDPLFPRNLILVAYKGESIFDTGYFYAPYIPFMLSATVPIPGTTQHVKYLLTRYAKLFVENGQRFYAVIEVDNLTAIGADRLPGSDIESTTPIGNVQGTDTIDVGSDLL